MAVFRVPCHSLDGLLKKGGDRQSWIAPPRSRCLTVGLVAAFVPRGDTSVSLATLFKNIHGTQIHFVRLQSLSDPSRQKPQCLPQPQKIISCRDFSPVSQHPEKPSLQRRQAHDRSVSATKRRDCSFAFLHL